MRTIILYLLMSVHGYFSAQRITDFRVIPAGESVAISFIISKGTSCSGYTIYHSTDSVNFSVLSDNPGVCGSSEAEERKSYTHTNPPLNRISYYRISLFPIETSPVMGLYVAGQNAAGFTIYPNPVLQNNDHLNLKIFNNDNTAFSCQIYSPDGTLLKQIHLTSGPADATIALSEFKNGLYTISLSNERKKYYSKFVILR